MLEQIGLEAILKDENFKTGLTNYMKGVGNMNVATDNTSKSLSSGFLDMGNSVLNFGKIVAKGLAVAGGAIIAGVDYMGKEAVNAASDLNEALNATNVVFGESAKVIQDFGKTAADVTGLSAADFNQMAAVTGAMLKNYGLGVEDSADWTVELAQRAADMASIFNTDVNDAFTAVNAALRGEADPIERYGVSMSAAKVEAYALAMGLAETTAELTEEDKTLARLNLLMEQTDSIAGDFVNTNDQLANGARVNKARWENFMATLGTGFLPIVTQVQSAFMDIAEKVMPMVLEAVAPVADWLGKNMPRAIAYVSKLWTSKLQPAMESFGKVIQEKVIPVVQDIIAWFQENLPKAISFVTEHWDEFKGALIAVGAVLAGAALVAGIVNIIALIGMIASPIGLIVAAAALLGAAWAGNWGGIRDVLTQVWNDTLKPAFEELQAWLAVNIPIAIEALKGFWENTLKPALEVVWAFITTTLIPAFAEIVSWLAANIPVAIATVSEFWNTTLKPALETIWSFIVTSLIPAFLDIWNWLSTTIPPVIQSLSDLWTGTLLPALTDIWTFISENVIPIFESLGTLLSEAVRIAIEGFALLWTGTVQPALNDIWTFISENILPIFTEIGTFLSETLSPIISEFVTDKLESLSTGLSTIQTWLEKVKNWIDKLATALQTFSWGEFGDGAMTNSPAKLAVGLEQIRNQVPLLENALAGMQTSLANYTPTVPEIAPGTILGGAALSAANSTLPISTVTNNRNVNLDMSGMSVNNGMDHAQLVAIIRQTIREEMRS